MKKSLLVLTVVLTGSFAVWAGPPHPGHGCRPCPRPMPCHPCPPPRHHCSSGVVEAAAITSIVANGLNILETVAAPKTQVVVPAQPVVIQQQTPVVQQPVVIQQSTSYVPASGTVIVR